MKLVFATSNSTEFAKHLDAGYCFGMSCDWANESLASDRGKGVTHKGQLSEFKWAIGQTAYETVDLADRTLIASMGLKVESYKKIAITSFEDVCRTAYGLPVGTYVFCIDGDGGGHAMGFRRVTTTDVLGRTAESLQWLDPNLGLYEFGGQSDFVTNAGAKLDELYGTGEADPDERLMDNAEFFKVKKA